MTADTFNLIIDPSRKAVACVLLQALHRCPYGSVLSLFHVNTWLDSPTPGMVKVSGTREEWERYADVCNKAHGAAKKD